MAQELSSVITGAGKTDPQPETPVTPESTTEVEPVIDYKTELEQTKERLRKAEYTLRKTNMASKGQKPVEEPEAVLERDEVKVLVEDQVNERLQVIREQEARDDIEDELYKMSENEDERELIRLNYEKRIHKTGYSRSAIRDDLAAAQLLANSKKYLKTNKELTASLIAKSTTGNSSAGSNLDRPDHEEDYQKQFSQKDLAIMKRAKVPEAKLKELAKQIKNR